MKEPLNLIRYKAAHHIKREGSLHICEVICKACFKAHSHYMVSKSTLQALRQVTLSWRLMSLWEKAGLADRGRREPLALVCFCSFQVHSDHTPLPQSVSALLPHHMTSISLKQNWKKLFLSCFHQIICYNNKKIQSWCQLGVWGSGLGGSAGEDSASG